MPREVVSSLRDVRRAAERAVHLGALATALGNTLQSRTAIVVSSTEIVAAEKIAFPCVAVALGSRDGSLAIGLEMETELAHLMVARVLDRPRRLRDPLLPAQAPIEGAALAIVSRVARLAHLSADALVPLGPGGLRFAPGERRLLVRATVLVDDEAFAAQAYVRLEGLARFHDAASGTRPLASLGALPIELPVVAAVSLVSREEIGGLAVGDAFLPGAGWSVHQKRGMIRAGAPPPGDGVGRFDEGFIAGAIGGDVTLVSPTHDRGLAGVLGEDGSIVVGAVRRVPLDSEEGMDEAGRQDDTTMVEPILEAPIVVRVELGAVTMTAREWAALAPGDVVSVGRRIGDLASLRVAGVEVARGELVDIEGELGVRIRALGGAT